MWILSQQCPPLQEIDVENIVKFLRLIKPCDISTKINFGPVVEGRIKTIIPIRRYSIEWASENGQAVPKVIICYGFITPINLRRRMSAYSCSCRD